MVIRALLSVLVFTCVTGFAQAEEPYTEVEKLLDSSTTILGQPFQYPNTGTANVTAVIVTMQPGEKTAKHLHEVPLFGYMLEGELTVSYDGHGKKIYKTGDSLIEAINVWHVGENTGTTPVRILAVFMGADGAKNTVVDK